MRKVCEMTNAELANECDSVADTLDRYGGRGCGRKLHEAASRLRKIADADDESEVAHGE